MKLGKPTTTARGFGIIKFRDDYDAPCSIQQSSNAGRNCLWIGIDDAAPKILHGNARRLGVECHVNSGWVPYPIPEEVLLSTRMHLNEKQVKALIKTLQGWIDTGDLK